MEGTHRQLGTGLADGLRGDDADRLADVDRLAGRQRAAVAGRADAELDSQVSTERTLTSSTPAATSASMAGSTSRSVPRATIELPLASTTSSARCGRRRRSRRARARPAHRRARSATVHRDAALGAAVLLADDDVLRHVHQTTGQVTRVGGTQRGVGETLAGTVGGDEVLQHRQALAERGLDRARDDLTLRVGHQTTDRRRSGAAGACCPGHPS